MQIIKTTGWAIAALGIVSAARGADQRIAVIRLEQVLKAHPETAGAEAVLDKQREEFAAERRAMIEKLEEMKAEFDQVREESESRALSDDRRTELRKELEERYVALKEQEREFQETQLARQRDIADQGKRLRERIVGKIRNEVEAYAKKEGYAIVLNGEDAGMSAFGVVLYASDKVDITDAIIKRVAADAADQ
jgi:Skp family chaperone for outer membrane proteins